MSIQKTKKPGSESSEESKKKPTSAEDEEEDDIDISDLVDKKRMKEADELMEKYRERSGE